MKVEGLAWLGVCTRDSLLRRLLAVEEGGTDRSLIGGRGLSG